MITLVVPYTTLIIQQVEVPPSFSWIGAVGKYLITIGLIYYYQGADI